jgi:hypothetical protein
MWLLISWLWLIPVDSGNGRDPFDEIKRQLARADCCYIEFISILQSEIFEIADSAAGSAYIAGDGRYNVKVGNDHYLYDKNLLYSYSSENNQVVIERLPPDAAVSREITFITRLDEFYRTQITRPGYSYRLYRLSSGREDSDEMPDSLEIFLVPDSTRLQRLEYLDINQERNVIVILSVFLDSICDEDRFEPTFPDSVEKIRL